ncbi:hypothetical protein [Streptomyces hirsutus]|uniref:hypothetical protein n=1 Tax=Streptomyces hirsutus TaxID=35620 RepID=UPI0012FF565E|nr:hypothetical protein [Streptomyces hirsutus]
MTSWRVSLARALRKSAVAGSTASSTPPLAGIASRLIFRRFLKQRRLEEKGLMEHHADLIGAGQSGLATAALTPTAAATVARSLFSS